MTDDLYTGGLVSFILLTIEFLIYHNLIAISTQRDRFITKKIDHFIDVILKRLTDDNAIVGNMFATSF